MSTHQNSIPAAARDNGRLMWPLAAIVFLASALMMMFAARGDLAIDEVVSLNKALGIHSWTEIFTQNQNDNNHLLNTLFMSVFGPQRHLFIYRVPAVIFGIASLAVLMVTSARFGKTLPLWVACLSGLSYPMILYSS
ncbi:MAG TPA: hypothetical protein VH251_06645, partial [Verrucomicrobiae bacterium]|nr:hypothetical protein [Verrucomicrobiae bacterium]